MAANMTGEKALRHGKGHTAESREKMRQTHLAAQRIGPKSTSWTGGRHMSNDYVMVSLATIPEDQREKYLPMATSKRSTTSGYLPEHRLVMALSLGRPLTTKEQVHHVNGIRTDNRLQNLELHDPVSHSREHARVAALVRRLQQENADLRSLLLTWCAATSLTGGSTTST